MLIINEIHCHFSRPVTMETYTARNFSLKSYAVKLKFHKMPFWVTKSDQNSEAISFLKTLDVTVIIYEFRCYKSNFSTNSLWKDLQLKAYSSLVFYTENLKNHKIPNPY